jgi:FtsP/CotA-like multicopper oxidase with cupredoxin domain
MHGLVAGFLAAMVWAMLAVGTLAQSSAGPACKRPAVGSAVEEPADLRSENGVLRVELAFRSSVDAAGRMNFCYVDKDGRESPNLRVHPGDTLILSLKNEATARIPTSAAPVITSMNHAAPGEVKMHEEARLGAKTDECAGGGIKEMAAGLASTNLHFHGITVPPVCHEDDVLHTMILPGDAAFEYRFQIPKDEPPGLYWYHPHIHGSTKAQVMGGASGALIVEGIERANPELAGLPERVFVIRDQKLLNPNAAPSGVASGAIPPVVLDADGDVKNTGTGTGRPAQDLSLNFVPVPYPDYPLAVITMKPGERQLWRVLNASAITYLNLQLIYEGQAQAVRLVAVDGIPLGEQSLGRNRAISQNHLGVPPGGRIEFEVSGPPEGVRASLVTRSVNTGPGGENDPTRPLATIIGKANAPEPRSRLADVPIPLPHGTLAWLGSVTPVRTRKLYFSEVLQDPHDPNSPTTFFLTVDGETPKAFDMSSDTPNIVAHQGDVEDWIIENRSQELHAFHIHQVHFLLLEWFGLAVNEAILRDTVNVPYWDGKNPVYPRVKLRVDFRDPNAIGLFPYHCHLLEHEDSGMMGLIRVDPPTQTHGDDGARSSEAIPTVK